MNITYRNNWEYDEYYINGKLVKKLIRIGYNGEEYDVISHEVSVPYSDMGHTYTSTSTHFFINMKVLGVEVMVDLNEIIPKNPNIAAIIYTFEE